MDAPSFRLLDLARRRRSMRRLRPVEIPDETIRHILEVARWTPSSYNSQPWHVLVVRERLDELWNEIERAGVAARAGRDPSSFLERLAGYRGAGAVFFIFLDRQVVEEQVRQTTYAPAESVEGWALQSVGMFQLSLWLAIVEAGLSVSLHHFTSEEEAIYASLGIPSSRFQLIGVMPVGLPAVELTPGTRRPLEDIVSWEKWPGEMPHPPRND